MAEHLASIFGTEKDRVNCPFYFKIGACRHGDRCSRLHTKPTISPTLLLSNMYQRPDMITPVVDPNQGQALDPDKVQVHFEDFYEDLFEELSKYGEIQSLNICDNLADHMVGNVYVQFKEEDHAANALMNLTGRFYSGLGRKVKVIVVIDVEAEFDKLGTKLITRFVNCNNYATDLPNPKGRPIIVDFSPVTDFREATCRQYEENVCNRGGYCNFMHLKKISRELRKRLFGRNRRWQGRSRSRSRSPPRHRNYDDRSHSGRGSGRRDYDRQHGHSGRNRLPRSRSPRRRSNRSRSPVGRDRSPIRESSAERRAKIEQWNREKELEVSGNNRNDSGDDQQGVAQNGDEIGVFLEDSAGLLMLASAFRKVKAVYGRAQIPSQTPNRKISEEFFQRKEFQSQASDHQISQSGRLVHSLSPA
ncbi:splicing factor U2af small subunit B-like [Senna tora]|uniref:Splicing factor U2af small subunit B-like n=1 Tax=Senna tora TaxID=362788 RepID=A0A834WF82_9FABA|nr:splicing factor U2af small subunit B-like [Senna tora]